MQPFKHPRDDERSTIELINVALTESDDDVVWHSVAALHWRGSREVLDEAWSLCKSHCAFERRLGAWILSQLGVHPGTFPNERFSILCWMLRFENDVDVLRMIFVSFYFLHEPASVPVVAPYRKHADPELRVAVATALSGHEDGTAIRALIELTNDEDPEVRNWATFGLGTQTELDTPELREALVRRLDDEDDETRGEAQVGLARRRDARVIPSIVASLRASEADRFPLEAAELTGDPALVESLIELRSREPEDPALLERAIAACGRP